MPITIPVEWRWNNNEITPPTANAIVVQEVLPIEDGEQVDEEVVEVAATPLKQPDVALESQTMDHDTAAANVDDDYALDLALGLNNNDVPENLHTSTDQTTTPPTTMETTPRSPPPRNRKNGYCCGFDGRCCDGCDGCDACVC